MITSIIFPCMRGVYVLPLSMRLKISALSFHACAFVHLLSIFSFMGAPRKIELGISFCVQNIGVIAFSRLPVVEKAIFRSTHNKFGFRLFLRYYT